MYVCMYVLYCMFTDLNLLSLEFIKVCTVLYCTVLYCTVCGMYILTSDFNCTQLYIYTIWDTVCMYVCMYVCIYIFMCSRMYTCIYFYTIFKCLIYVCMYDYNQVSFAACNSTWYRRYRWKTCWKCFKRFECTILLWKTFLWPRHHYRWRLWQPIWELQRATPWCWGKSVITVFYHTCMYCMYVRTVCTVYRLINMKPTISSFTRHFCSSTSVCMNAYIHIHTDKWWKCICMYVTVFVCYVCVMELSFVC